MGLMNAQTRRTSRRDILGLPPPAILRADRAGSRRGGLCLTPDEMIALRGEPVDERGAGHMIFTGYVHYRGAQPL